MKYVLREEEPESPLIVLQSVPERDPDLIIICSSRLQTPQKIRVNIIPKIPGVNCKVKFDMIESLMQPIVIMNTAAHIQYDTTSLKKRDSNCRICNSNKDGNKR